MAIHIAGNTLQFAVDGRYRFTRYPLETSSAIKGLVFIEKPRGE